MLFIELLLITSNLTCFRDPDEPTGDEPDDADLETPKIYEAVTVVSLQLYLQNIS